MHLAMPSFKSTKSYTAISGDEEKTSRSGRRDDGEAADGLLRRSSFSSETSDEVYAPQQPRRRHLNSGWTWLAHAVLLSISMTLFAFSFCSRTAHPTEAAFARRFSSYCTCRDDPGLHETRNDDSRVTEEHYGERLLTIMVQHRRLGPYSTRPGGITSLPS